MTQPANDDEEPDVVCRCGHGIEDHNDKRAFEIAKEIHRR